MDPVRFFRLLTIATDSGQGLHLGPLSKENFASVAHSPASGFDSAEEARLQIVEQPLPVGIAVPALIVAVRSRWVATPPSLLHLPQRLQNLAAAPV